MCMKKHFLYLTMQQQIFEHFLSSKAHFVANVFHEITGIADVLKRNANEQNEQTIKSSESR